MVAIELYSDGGVIGKNPSLLGGVWAWCHVVGGEKIQQGSGIVRPTDFGMEKVTNNLTEFLAMLNCLEAVPEAWSGYRMFCDSELTIGRFQNPYGVGMAGIPAELFRRMTALPLKRREIEYVLVGGHPTRKELAAGVHKDGRPVSRWNAWCDSECNRVKEGYFTGLKDKP